MDNILTPEQAAQPVTQADLIAALNELVKLMSESDARYQEHTFRALDDVLNSVARSIDALEYKRIRDMRFVISIISELNHIKREDLLTTYANWCDEFDQLNRGEDNDTSGS